MRKRCTAVTGESCSATPQPVEGGDRPPVPDKNGRATAGGSVVQADCTAFAAPGSRAKATRARTSTLITVPQRTKMRPE